MKIKKLLLNRGWRFVILVLLVSMFAIVLEVSATELHRAHTVSPLTAKELEDAGIAYADKLMIVAHPDDETLWGGGHLSERGYFVVCITNGRNRVRHDEFYKVMKQSGNHGIILNYPDKVLRRKDNWNTVRDGITADVRLVMTYQNWKLIVTHNRKGEYGHIHHKMTHRIVTGVYKDTKTASPLYCFGRYYTEEQAATLPESAIALTEEQMQLKDNLESIYVSQRRSMARRCYMNPYENWTLYQT